MPDLKEDPDVEGLDIAIVGMAGRFPGAPDVDTFWRNIRDGVESVRWFSDEELRERGVPLAVLSDPNYVKAGVAFDGMDRFDAEFFGYTPRDAAYLDPQQRLFLESAWEALEHAGYDPQRCADRTGIYAGAGASLYLMKHLLSRNTLGHGGQIGDLLGLLSSNSADSLCTRVAYKLNLRGPAMTIQTACSTSLTAVHVACQALLGHECDMALAGGVSLNLLQEGGYLHQTGAIFSPDGHCRAFDAKAAGMLLGSGVGIVVLKRLSDARRDLDTVHAVIKGSAANNDGSQKVGFTAPGVQGQSAAIRAALAVAGVSADSIGYVEAHGTGTTLGDPIEIAALTQAFRAGTRRTQFCAVGSVKTNIGHLDAAAGIAGLIKTVQAIKHATLPPSLNFEQPNPQIDFAASPFYVNTDAQPWPPSAGPRRAGVSSFGIGGTNAHVVIEEAASTPVSNETVSTLQVLPLSARSEAALQQACQRLAQHLRNHPGQALCDVAHTLWVGRKAFAHRVAVIAKDVSEAVSALEDSACLPQARVVSNQPSVAFVFPGQGAQHVAMGRSLYEREAVFRKTVDDCCERLAPSLGVDLRELLYPTHMLEAEAALRLEQTAITQPALFVVEYAMARQWMSWGVKPDALLGHSIGEYVAACLSGVFSLEDALEIVAVRGRLLQATASGAMLAVSLTESAVQPYLHDSCELAAVNASDLCVLAGSEQAIERAEQELARRGSAARRLYVSRAFHSSLVEPMLGEFETRLSRIKLSAPRIPFVSNLSGRWITAEEACSPGYWVRHVRGVVRFADGLRQLFEHPERIVLEVGPGETLSGLARRHPDAGERTLILASQCHPTRREQNAGQPARCVAQLWMAGVEIDAAAWSGSGRRRVALPTYPFERQSYWIDPPSQATSSRPVIAATDDRAVTRHYDDWFHVPSWKRTGSVVSSIDAKSNRAGNALVLSDSLGLGDRIIEQLRVLQRPVVLVRTGGQFARVDARSFTVRPGNREDFAQLLRAVEQEAGPVSDICHLWSLDREIPGARSEDVIERGFYSLLALAQALGASGAATPERKVSITVVANHLENVSGAEPICPRKATVLGACRVIPQEFPNVSCRVIDVVLPEPGPVARLARQLVSDIQRADGEPLVAIRGSHRWVKRFERMQTTMAFEPRLRKYGVYVITGGFGGIGLTLAKYFAKVWQARLVLLGRHVPAAQERVASGSISSRDVIEIESLGAEVLAIQADVTDAVQVRSAIESARRRFGDLHGVIHAAGVAGGGMIANRSREAIERVIAPKVHGSQNLLDAVGDESLDFVVLCSSLTAITGAFGQSDYCAANCFLDALAIRTSQRADLPVLSINWDTWRDVGMAAGQQRDAKDGIAAADAGALFEIALSGMEHGQLLVSTIALEEQFERTQSTRLIERVANRSSTPRHQRPRPALHTAYAQPESELEQALAAMWSELLGIAPVGVDDDLFELGGDSLLAIQLLAKVRGAYAVELHPAAFFKTPTLRALAVLVETRLLDDIENVDSLAASA